MSTEYIKNYPHIINDIINTYFQNNIKSQIMTYFRLVYVFYIITKYIFCRTIDENMAKDILIDYLDKTINKNNKNKEIIINNIKKYFPFYYKTFFIDENIYFSVYFNNLIKYFFPIPYEYEIYCPFITYRNKVQNIYKKNNIDYLSTINHFDKNTIISKFKYNVNDIYNEIDIHLPINKFNNNLYPKDVIFYVGTNNKLYIAKVCELKNNKFNLDVLFERDFIVPNLKHYESRIPYELLFPDWKQVNKTLTLGINDIVYISIHKKITKDDMFKAFKILNFSTENYKYLFHDTDLEITKNEINKKFLTSPLYLYFTPIPPGGRIIDYTQNRHCIIFEIKKEIKDALDVTRSIVTDNPLVEYIKNKHINEKAWKSYDNVKILDYYKDKKLDEFVSENNSCLSDNINESVEDFIKKRPYCDIHNRRMYTGKRKFLEIIFKTRKYNYSQIWTSMFIEDYKKFGYGEKVKEINLIYHPKREKTFAANLDIHLTAFCERLEINAVFSTDHDLSFKNGGEIMLTHPKNYISVYSISKDNCSKK